MCRKSLLWIGIFLLFGLTVRTMGAEPFQQDGGPDAIVSIEAEHYDNKVDNGLNIWALVTSGPFSFGTDTEAGVQLGTGSVTPEGTGSNPYNGALDEIRLYDRALSPFEVRYLAGQR